MKHQTFSVLERVLAFLAGLFNLIVGLAFFFLPELKFPFPLWPTSISPVLDRFIGAIILGNSAGAFLLCFLMQRYQWRASHLRWSAFLPTILILTRSTSISQEEKNAGKRALGFFLHVISCI